MFQKSAHRASSPDQFKNGPNYLALVLSFVLLIIAIFAPVDRGTHIYLVIFSCLGFVIGSENDRINENGIYRYLLFFLHVFSLGSALSKYHIHCGMQERPTS